jgi:hypothetical protein
VGSALHDAIRARDEAANPDLTGRWDHVDEAWQIGTAPDGRRIAVIPLMYTAAVIIGRPHQATWYDDRWCYTSATAALAAAQAWDGTGEPDGWHRHPPTGRRRPDGDPSKEHIHP